MPGSGVVPTAGNDCRWCVFKTTGSSYHEKDNRNPRRGRPDRTVRHQHPGRRCRCDQGCQWYPRRRRCQGWECRRAHQARRHRPDHQDRRAHHVEIGALRLPQRKQRETRRGR